MTCPRPLKPVRPCEAVLLDVPVIQQASVTSCALATVSGVVWYLTGRQVPQRELSALLGQRWTVDGTRMGDAIGLIERLTGTSVEERAVTTFSTVTAALRRGQPMLAAVHVDAQRAHMVCVVGALTGTDAKVVVNDPNFRWPLVIPWPEFAGALQRIGYVGGMPAALTARKEPLQKQSQTWQQEDGHMSSDPPQWT